MRVVAEQAKAFRQAATGAARRDHRANSDAAAASAPPTSGSGSRMKNIVSTAATTSTALQLGGDRPVERADRLVEIHHLDDAQVIERADDAGDDADDGEPDQVRVDGGEEDVELARRTRRAAGCRPSRT